MRPGLIVARLMFVGVALAFAPHGGADPAPATPRIADVVSHWRAAIHAEAGRIGAQHWRQRVEEDGITRTDDIWIDHNGRYRTTSTSEFSADDELLAGAVAEYRDWDGFVRDLDGTELQRLRRDAFSAGVLAFGPTASGFAHATIADSADHGAWMLIAAPRGGASAVWYIDKQSWLPQKTTNVDGDGNTITTTFSQWSASSAGVLTPQHFVSTGADNGGGTATLISAAPENAGSAFSRLAPGPSDVAMASDPVRIP